MVGYRSLAGVVVSGVPGMGPYDGDPCLPLFLCPSSHLCTLSCSLTLAQIHKNKNFKNSFHPFLPFSFHWLLHKYSIQSLIVPLWNIYRVLSLSQPFASSGNTKVNATHSLCAFRSPPIAELSSFHTKAPGTPCWEHSDGRGSPRKGPDR